MKPKTPAGIWALRGVTITIAVVVLLVVGTIGYSVYKDYTAITPYLGGGSQATTGAVTQQGSSEIVSFNFTIPNRGLYALSVSVTCAPLDSNVVCEPSQVTVPPGADGVLRFRMTIVDAQQFAASSNHTIPGTVSIALEPFANVTVGTDFGGLFKTGGP